MTAVNSVIDLTIHNSIAVLIINSPPVNALSADVRTGLELALRDATTNAAVEAVVIVCDGKTFVAGADIREFGRPRGGPRLKDFQDVFEDSSKPIVAAIHGTALGGG